MKTSLEAAHALIDAMGFEDCDTWSRYIGEPQRRGKHQSMCVRFQEAFAARDGEVRAATIEACALRIQEGPGHQRDRFKMAGHLRAPGWQAPGETG